MQTIPIKQNKLCFITVLSLVVIRDVVNDFFFVAGCITVAASLIPWTGFEDVPQKSWLTRNCLQRAVMQTSIINILFQSGG